MASSAPDRQAQVEQGQRVGHVVARGDEGQHHDRVRPGHREQVDRVGAQKVGSRPRVAQPAAERRDLGLGRAGVGVERDEQGERGRERHQVDHVGRARADGDHDEPAEGRTEDRRGGPTDHAQRGGGTLQLVGHEALVERPDARTLEAAGGHDTGVGEEDQPHLGVVGERVEEQNQDRRHRRGLGRQDQATPVQPVRQDAPVQTEEDDRHELDEAQRSHQQRRVGQQSQLERHGDKRRLAPQLGDEPGDVETPILLGHLERRQVNAEASRTHAGGPDRHPSSGV